MSTLAPHLESEIYLIHLCHLRYTNRYTGLLTVDLRLHFHTREDYIWQGKTWTYLPFAISNINYSTELDNSDAVMEFPNVDMIRNIIKQNDGLRRGVVTIYSFFPESNTEIYRRDTFQISNASTQSATITLNLRNPLNAINGTIPSRVFEGHLFRELPLRKSNSL